MSRVVSDMESELLTKAAQDFGTGPVNLGREASFFPTDNFTISATFELNNLSGGRQAVLWNHKQYGIRVEEDDLKISLRGDDGRLHTTTVPDVFDEAGWHDVQVVLNDDDNSLEFWLDGSIVYSGVADGVDITSTSYRDVYTGSKHNGSNDLDGQVASVFVTDEALEIDGTQSSYERMFSIKGEPVPAEATVSIDPEITEELPQVESPIVEAENAREPQPLNTNEALDTSFKIGTAGIPIDLAMTQDYDLIFRTLSEAGIKVFCPVTIYEEIPEVKSLDLEADFYPPPFGSATGELYDLAREYGIKITFSADVMYPLGQPMPDAGADPLSAIISAGGRDIIHGILNYDEPAFLGIPSQYSQAVYEQVKSIDPSIQVQQIHAPVGGEADPSVYLNTVLEHSQWADNVGFDVYPISEQPGIQSPYSNGQIIDPVSSLKDYVSWLDNNLPDKSHAMVLQAFEYADLYSDEMIASFSAEEQASSRQPTALEMRSMLNAVSEVDEVFWFGASFQESADGATWQSVLSTSEKMSNGELNIVMGDLSDLDAQENIIAEDAAAGAGTGIQLSAIDPDAIDVVSYTLGDNRFVVDEAGYVRLAADVKLDFETETSISLTATARSTDGSERVLEFDIQIQDIIDAVSGTSSSDQLLGASGADNINGFNGDDLINAMEGNDQISSGAGNDFVYGGSGNDTISGNDGSDVLVGEAGNDLLNGDAGDDFIDGGAGDDIIIGGLGADQIAGDSGSDTLSGDLGNDILVGGTGADTFIFGSGDGNDYILDFVAGEDFLKLEDGITRADLTVTGTADHTQILIGDDSITLLGVSESQRGDIDILFG